MGASITVASGISHAGDPRDIFCTIGDSTFLHTGIQGLLNAVYNGANITVVILDNRITAMTGHQPNPNSGMTACGAESPPVSLEAICRACGVIFVESVNPYEVTGMVTVLQEAKKRKGVKVIIAKQLCVISARRAGIKRGSYQVNLRYVPAAGPVYDLAARLLSLQMKGPGLMISVAGAQYALSSVPSGQSPGRERNERKL